MTYKNLSKQEVVKKVNTRIKYAVQNQVEDILDEVRRSGECDLELGDVHYEFLKDDFEGDFAVIIDADVLMTGWWQLKVVFRSKFEDTFSDSWKEYLYSDAVKMIYMNGVLEILK